MKFVFLLYLLFHSAISLEMNWTILSNLQPFAKGCCGTYELTGQLFFCAYAGTPGELFMYNPDGSPIRFIPGLINRGHIEMKPVSVKLAPNSAFPHPGWNFGDIFLPDVDGSVTRVEQASKITRNWVKIPGVNEITMETVFDDTGSVYDGDMIITFKQAVYRISPSGNYSLIIKSDKLNNYEGVVVVANEPRYGTLAGTIIIPQTGVTKYIDQTNTPSVNETAGRNLAIVYPNKTISIIPAPCHVDSLFVVNQNDQFYAMDYRYGKVYYSSWDNLKKNNFLGEILLQCEQLTILPNEVISPSSFFRLFWNGNAVKTEPVTLSQDSPPPDHTGEATYPGFEHFCVSRGAPGGSLPGGFSFCYRTSYDSLSKLNAFKINNTIAKNWNFVGSKTPFVYPNTSLPSIINGAMQISIIQDSNNLFYLQILNGSPIGGNGTLDLELEYSFEGIADPTMLLRIQNNPGDTYFWDGNQGKFSWAWENGTTGAVIGPMAHIITGRRFSLKFNVLAFSGLDTIILSHSTGRTNQSMSISSFTLEAVSCTCGNGILEVGTLEACDYAIANNTCCSTNCQMLPASHLCNATDPADLCLIPSYCDSVSPTCPPVKTAEICNCTSPRYGYNCSNVRCDILASCGDCNTFTECSWCCDSNSCVASGTCLMEYPRSCANCSDDCETNGGSCQCGKCYCPPGKSGNNCEFFIGCDGEVIYPGDTSHTIDLCGICGGNNTACLGCDGTFYGPTYDNCGVCGGNGTSCFDVCPASSCEECMEQEGCGWCSVSSKCTLDVYQCTEPLKRSCDKVDIAVIVGASIGAGVIAAIAIGAVAVLVVGAVGGKKGYDAYMRHKGEMEGVQNNPLYDDDGRNGFNPFYNISQVFKTSFRNLRGNAN